MRGGVSFSDEQFEALLQRLEPPRVQRVSREYFDAGESTIRWGAQSTLSTPQTTEPLTVNSAQLVHVHRPHRGMPTTYSVAFVIDPFGGADIGTLDVFLNLTLGVGSASVNLKKLYPVVTGASAAQVNDLFQVPAVAINANVSFSYVAVAGDGPQLVFSLLVAPIVE
jgi:hypothetical protein